MLHEFYFNLVWFLFLFISCECADNLQVGIVRPDVLKELFKYPEVFVIKDRDKTKVVELHPAFRDYNEKTQQIDAVLRKFRQSDIFFALRGWRDEVRENEIKF